jgi:hypothetical protein
MDYDYGCQILNRYNFFLDKEDEDPSEILANASSNAETKAAAAKEAGKKDAGKGGKTTATSAKSATTAAKPGSAGKDKKQPLQQKDNSTASKTEEKKDSSMNLDCC